MALIPWDNIKVEFVTGMETLREISERYVDVVSYGRIRIVAAENKWTAKRLEYRDAETKLIAAQKLNAAIRNRVEFDEQVQKVGRLAVAHAAYRIHHHNEALSAGQADSPLLLKDSEIKNLVDITERGVNIMYRVWDIPSPVQRTQELGSLPPADDVKRELAGITEDLRYMELEIISTESSGDNGGGNGSGNGTDE